MSSTNKSIQASIAKLNATNWHTWSKEVETYLTMEDLWDVIDPDEAEPTIASAIKRDKKAFAQIWFLVDADSREPIVETKSGRTAWASLKAEYEKDNPSTRLNLRQRFHSITHDLTVGVIPFTNEVLGVVRQLDAIGRKPLDDEIADRLLIGLDSSFTAVRTHLALRVPAPNIKQIIAALKEYEENEAKPTMNPLALYAKPAFMKNRNPRGKENQECDWGNRSRKEGVCWRCGRAGHVAQNCIADMPAEEKARILQPHAHVAEETQPPSSEFIGYTNLPSHDVNSLPLEMSMPLETPIGLDALYAFNAQFNNITIDPDLEASNTLALTMRDPKDPFGHGPNCACCDADEQNY
jgi:hypothetical protein